MHLIVLIHGMWGSVRDFNYIVDQLAAEGVVLYDGAEAEFDAESAPPGIVYRTRSNEGYFTYDGVDVCGMRVASEIMQVVESLSRQDVKISELSIVGYSMGGLMARYAIGLLCSRGVFDKIRPHTFVTTCAPHIGVNALGPSLGARVLNAIGPWSMARTSRQVFLRDSDHPGKKPLFYHMLQPQTPWVEALSRFDRRVLYANLANDHRCEFYTAAAEDVDPFKDRDLTNLEGPFVEGYAPVVLQGSMSPFFAGDVGARNGGSAAGTPRRPWLVQKLCRIGRTALLLLRIGVVLPLWFVAFLINANYQFLASRFRTRGTLKSGAHLLDVNVEGYLEDGADAMVEDVYRTVQRPATSLSLTPLMAQMISLFNNNQWEKFFLRIKETPQAHSAAIMKHRRRNWAEGELAVKHLVSVLTR